MDVSEDEGESEVNAMRSNALKAADEALKRKTSKKGEAGTEGFVGLNQANDNKVKKKFGRRQSRSSTDSSEAFDEAPVESFDPPPAPPVQNTAKGLKRSLFLRPFADASTVTLSSGRCEDHHMMLLTFTMGSTI